MTMTSGALDEADLLTGGSEAFGARRARRVAGLFAIDPQFRAARQLPAVIEAARRPGVRLAPMLASLVDGYADRPALGQRRREVTTDPATGQPRSRLLPEFDTVTYREQWTRVGSIAAAWSHDPANPVRAGDFVATIGFSSADYLTIDLVCAHLGLVSVPLQHNASATQLRAILAEAQIGRAHV